MSDDLKDGDDASEESKQNAKPPIRKFTVRNFIDADQLRRDVAYSNADIETAFMNQASMFIHYGVLAAKASKQVNDVKIILENQQAAVYRGARNEAAKLGEKVTEGMLENIVMRNPQIIATKRALNEAMQVESVAKAAAEGFRHRRDMLVQHGLRQREEMKGELAIGLAKARDDEAEALKQRIIDRQLGVRE